MPGFLATVRNLARSPGYSAAFILTLGLGIGANTAIFSVVRGVLLKPIPYRSGDRLVHLRQTAVQNAIPDATWSVPEISDYRSVSKTIDYRVVIAIRETVCGVVSEARMGKTEAVSIAV